MTEDEITVGNWVRMKGGTRPRQINSALEICNAHLYDAIPITSEILKEIGFVTGMYSTYLLGDGKWLEYYHHEHRLRLWWKGIDEWENHSEVQTLMVQCTVHDVHELQQALKLCKISLEINLSNIRIRQKIKH